MHAVQLGRHRAGRARFLPRQAEVADLDRFCRVAEVIDLGHPAHAPTLRARNQERNAGVAFPPVFVGVLEAHQARQQGRIGRIGHIPDLVALPTENAQHVKFVGIALGQHAAGADAHHLGAAVLVGPFKTGDMLEILRMRRVGHVDDRGAVEFRLARQRIDRLGNVRRPAVMADISDVAIALMRDRRLIGTAPLQVIAADEAHVHGLRRRADLSAAAQEPAPRTARPRRPHRIDAIPDPTGRMAYPPSIDFFTRQYSASSRSRRCSRFHRCRALARCRR